MNPYYDAAKLGLEMLSFEDPEASYDFDTICFWATSEGRVYTAHDSGCSCPEPFEGFKGESQKDVIQLLECVGSVAQAETSFDTWNKDYENKPRHSQSARDEVAAWVKARLR